MVADLQEQGLLVEIKAHTLMTPKGDRTGSVIEPMLTSQWFVAMSATPNGGEPDSEFKGLSLATKPKKPVDSGAVRFIPENWVNTYNQWRTTSKTGVFRANCGGAIKSPRGTTKQAMFTLPAIRKKPKNKPAKQA